MAEKEVPDGYSFGFGERHWSVVDAAAGERGGPTGSPIEPEIPVGVDTHAIREVRVDGASLSPKSILGARKFVPCRIKWLVLLKF